MTSEDGQGDLGYVWQRMLNRRVKRRSLFRYTAYATGAIGLGAVACSNTTEKPRSGAVAEATKTPKSGGVFRMLQTQNVAHFDPQLTYSGVVETIYSHVSQRLIKTDKGPHIQGNEIKLVPDLAEKWEQPDEKTYVFTLRQGVKWHDVPPVNGREFVADDAVFTYQRYMKNDYAMSWLFTDVDRVEAKDKYTVVFRLKEPSSLFIRNLAWQYSWIVSREVVEKDGDLRKHNPVGMGPFLYTSHDPNVMMVFKRNPNWYLKGLPYVDEVRLLWIPDATARQAAFLAGEVELFSAADKAQADDMLTNLPTAKSDGYWIDNTRSPQINLRRPPFSDKRVRKAIRMVIDQKAMGDSLYSGAGRFNGIFNASMADFALPEDELKELYKQDIQGAKRLLADAGYPNGFQTTVTTTTGYGQLVVDLGEIFMANLRSIGLTIEVKMVDYATFLKHKADGTYDIAVGLLTGYMDPGQLLEGHYMTGAGRNETGLSDPKLDDMIRQQKRELNVAERKKLIGDIERYAAEEVNAILPTPAYMTNHLWNPKVMGYRPHQTYGLDWSSVWLDL